MPLKGKNIDGLQRKVCIAMRVRPSFVVLADFVIGSAPSSFRSRHCLRVHDCHADCTSDFCGKIRAAFAWLRCKSRDTDAPEKKCYSQ